MTTRPAIMRPAVLFASRADKERAVSVMKPIMTELVPMRQIARMPPSFDDGMWQVAQSEAVIPDAEQGDTRFQVFRAGPFPAGVPCRDDFADLRPRARRLALH